MIVKSSLKLRCTLHVDLKRHWNLGSVRVERKVTSTSVAASGGAPSPEPLFSRFLWLSSHRTTKTCLFRCCFLHSLLIYIKQNSWGNTRFPQLFYSSMFCHAQEWNSPADKKMYFPKTKGASNPDISLLVVFARPHPARPLKYSPGPRLCQNYTSIVQRNALKLAQTNRRWILSTVVVPAVSRRGRRCAAGPCLH